MDAVGYVRVSTARQADDGLGLDIQEKAIRRHCREHDLRLVAVHRDEGISGSLADRPGLGAALATVELGAAQVLVVYRLDRLARDLVIQETVIERLGRHDRRVVSVTEPDVDGSDATRVLIRQVLGAIAQYERALVCARMQAGRAAKAARGGFAYGSPAYGWAALHRELEPDPVEQATIARIAELVDAGVSYREMVRVLTAEGHRPKRSARWHPETLRRIVARLDPAIPPESPAVPCPHPS